MKEKTICGNCGAKMDQNSPKCPYCGIINEAGAEKEYIKNLYNIKENLEELESVPEETYRRETVKVWKRVLVILSVVLLLFLLGIGAFKWLEKQFSYKPEVSVKEQMLWEKENFPQFDIWYEEGNYKAIAEEMWKEENEYYSFWEWEHYEFISIYDTYTYSMERREYITDPNTANKNAAKFLLADVMRFLFFLRQDDYTAEEWELIQGWRPDMEEILYEDMKFTEEEAQELYLKINDQGYIDYDKCDKYAAKIWKRFIDQE